MGQTPAASAVTGPFLKMQITNGLQERSTNSRSLETAGKLMFQLVFAEELNAFASFRPLDHYFTLQEWGNSRENLAPCGLP